MTNIFSLIFFIYSLAEELVKKNSEIVEKKSKKSLKKWDENKGQTKVKRIKETKRLTKTYHKIKFELTRWILNVVFALAGTNVAVQI